VLVYVVGSSSPATAPSASSASAPAGAATVAPAAAPAAPPRADAEMLKQINATARAMAEVAKLKPSELAKRRVDVAKRISLIPQIGAASWSGPRTLLVTLNQTDGKDKALLEEVCRIITQHEEMRYTRIQMESPEDAQQRVRWRLCE
jgi:hypothetical protein